MQQVIELMIGGKTKRSTTGQHPVKIDWNNLPDASQEFVIKYGLKQYLADGMAGAENEATAKAGVEARVKKLLEADFTRTSGEGLSAPDTEDGRAMKLAKSAIRAALKAKNSAATKEAIDAAARKMVDGNEKWKAEAKKQLAAEAKAKETLADEIDLDDLIPAGTDEETTNDE